MEVSTFSPAGAAEGEDGWLDVLDVPVFPPPHATIEAASVNVPHVPKVPRTAGRARRAPTQTFRECIDFSCMNNDDNLIRSQQSLIVA